MVTPGLRIAFFLLLVGVCPSVFGADFTFIVWSDPHYDYWNDQRQRDNCINDINGIAETPYPTSIGGSVDTPAFVLVTGDITENDLRHQWLNADGDTNNDFTSGASRLLFPYYAIRGNHDIALNYGSDFIIDLHGELYYSFDYEGVHFVALDAVGDTPQFPPDQMEWLRDDLARLTPGTPVIPFLHYSPRVGEPDWDTLADALAGSNVPLVIHGHDHLIRSYTWRGFDVYSVGHNKNEDTNNGGFSVVHVTDTRLTVVSYSWVDNRWFTAGDLILSKPITGLPLENNPPVPTPTPPLPPGPSILQNGELESFAGTEPNQVALGWTAGNVFNSRFRSSPGMRGEGFGQTMERRADPMDSGEGFIRQTVDVIPGHTYRMAAWARSENGGDGGSPDYFPQNRAVAWYGIALDTDGGTDITAAEHAVMHHTGEDGYRPLAWHRFEVEAVAASGRMTVFLSYRIPQWKYRPPRVIWDHVSLVDLDALIPGSYLLTH
jgi:hypothetical protein